MNISLTIIKKSLSHFIERFHVIIFVVVILGGLGVVVLLLNNVILTSGNTSDYTPETSNAEFDQATIKQIEQLRTRDETGDQLDLSKGRTNPFVE